MAIGPAVVKMAESFEDQLVEKVCNYQLFNDVSLPQHACQISHIEISIILETFVQEGIC